MLLSFGVLCDEKQSPSWSGIVRTVAGEPIAGALVQLSSGTATFTDETSPRGEFRFVALPNGQYRLSIFWKGSVAIYGEPLNLPAGTGPVQLEAAGNGNLTVNAPAGAAASTGGEKLEQRAVSELPLNKRDFSQLLLLAAGTMTDSNGATNFTQQFAINGQRGTAAVFAMDGADISDPEMGGATFSNFNVDAVQEIKSSSGWMPAEIGRGAAGFTDILTRSGTDSLHGSAYEFLRNGAFDARNFFDRRSVANPGRIPPFHRNEFGFTNGGPVILPRVYNGRGRTYYFVEYQGFRQTLGTTQVIPVPTLDERAGRDTTAFPGETLLIPVDPRIAKILSRYPEPNDAQGPYGARTYATSSKVVTDSDQFSVRIDHKLSEKDQLFGRFSLDDITGPTTNPSQTVIDPSFAVRYIDRQRNAAIRYTRTVSPRFTVDSSISFTRTTPSFPTANHTDPALKFGDGLYESFNAAAGSVTAAIGNL
ncbi:MAG TPA: carboxypeptidase-like regulatory domain-containing protein, partial [Bryobacteraceae bacterium]|nr:carboxypeptidase-like regulatory domain-containing protein [Bryobacteraceae bacterium]